MLTDIASLECAFIIAPADSVRQLRKIPDQPCNRQYAKYKINDIFDIRKGKLKLERSALT